MDLPVLYYIDMDLEILPYQYMLDPQVYSYGYQGLGTSTTSNQGYSTTRSRGYIFYSCQYTSLLLVGMHVIQYLWFYPTSTGYGIYSILSSIHCRSQPLIYQYRLSELIVYIVLVQEYRGQRPSSILYYIYLYLEEPPYGMVVVVVLVVDMVLQDRYWYTILYLQRWTTRSRCSYRVIFPRADAHILLYSSSSWYYYTGPSGPTSLSLVLVV